jgi:spheroidene monooxygenase
MAVPHPDGPVADEVAVLVLAQMAPRARAWGWWRIVRGPGALKSEPGLRFAKVLGSGHDGGFGLRPSSSRLGLFLLFDGEAAAQAFVERSAHLQAWRERAAEICIAVLRTSAARGRWAGQGLTVTARSDAGTGPVAALTRASIRPSRVFAFWRHAPPSEAALAQAPGCRLAVGLGEAPLLRQATFSLWDDAQAMEAYARGPAHGAAIRAAYGRECFSESLFARFVPLSLQGRWMGRAYG